VVTAAEQAGKETNMRRLGPVIVVLALLVSVVPVTAAPGEQGTRPRLRRGSTGPYVVELQQRLNGWIAASRAVPRLAEDGIFGPRTDAAVRAYQRARGLEVDGIVGPKTWAALLGTPPPAPARTTPGITVALSCTGNPELTTITNGTRQTITIVSIGTLYQPRPEEPYRVNRALAAGARVTFQSGNAATATTGVTREYIYDNQAPTEGVRVVTSVGTVERRCR
jgi:hypothetical protein